jgi:hypothetical protein
MNKMKNLKFAMMALLSLLMVVTSCKKDEETPSETPESIISGDLTLSRKTSYGNDWIYYSLKDQKEVDLTDHLSSLTWDIAFNRYNVRTNSGLSGSGQGGAYDAGLVDFSSVIMAQESGYIVDDTIQIVEAFTGQGVDWMTSTGNDVFKDCIIRENSNTGPSYTPNNHIYVIKTADGKYAKIWIKNYYNAEGTSGFISFKYNYQTNGSLELQ